MPEHTPGPWMVEKLESGGSGCTGELPPYTEYSVIPCEDIPGPVAGEIANPANARLIAAAPEMLEVLQTIENDAGQIPNWLWDRIQAAIAKATGKEVHA